MLKSNSPFRRFILLLSATLIALTLAACGKGGDKKAEATKAPPSLLVSAEDLVVVASSSLSSGPTITGTVQPERKADLRAEVSAVVLQVLRENGDVVKRGDLLARLDDTAIRDAMASAEASVRAATQAFDQAARQLERVKTLRNSGMASVQALDDAETRRNNAQSDLEAARTRVAQARQQLQRTEVRAPFDGVVSERKVSAGDTAQIGKELLKVIDPTSMRLEGLVSADAIGEVKAGQTVSFRVNGYGEQEFLGKVRRVNPAANPTTRQVEVLVDFADKKQLTLSGLYAEGRIETASSEGFSLPPSTIVREGDSSSVWKVTGGSLKKTPVKLGDRDPRTGQVVLLSGLNAGDRLVRHPSVTLKDGQKVEMAKAPQPAAAVPADANAGTVKGK